MSSFATPADVENAWRALTDQESTVAATQLAFASAIIRQRFPTIDERITAGTLDAELVKHVTVAVALRHLRNPEGWRSEAIEDFSRTRDSALSTGELYLTEGEVALLTAAPVGGGAFTIKLGDPEPCEPLYYLGGRT